MVNYGSSNQDKFENANNIPLNNTTIWTSWQSNPVCIRGIACAPDDGCAWSLWPLSPWWRHVTEMSPHWPLEREIHDHCSPHGGPVMSFNVFLAFNQSNCWTKVELLCWWFGTPGRSCHVELFTVCANIFYMRFAPGEEVTSYRVLRDVSVNPWPNVNDWTIAEFSANG